MDELLAGPMAQPRLDAFLLGAFGVTALVLAAIGLYGVTAASVRQQTREVGVRMALGATPARVLRLVLGEAGAVVGIGVALGIVGAAAASRLLASLLFEVRPGDPLTLAGVSLVLVAVALVAAYVPARRAARVDPVQALRAD